MLRAVAVSKDKGLGIGEGSLVVFQPFFETIDLPYSAIRGEEFPVNVAVYNYLNEPQTVQLDLGQTGWFDVVGAYHQDHHHRRQRYRWGHFHNPADQDGRQ